MARLWRTRYLLPLIAFICSFSVVFSLTYYFYAPSLQTLDMQLDADVSATLEKGEDPATSNGASAEPPPPEEPAPRILLVSAFFPVSQAKHSVEDYLDWLKRFLGTVNADLYFFCPRELEDMIRSFRGDLPITIDTSYGSPYSTPPLGKHIGRYQEMHNWDPEKARHSTDLYAVWNAKPWLLDWATRIKRIKGQRYDYAFWTDAGAFRDDNRFDLGMWPDGRRVKEVFEAASKDSGTLRDRLIFFPLWKMPDAKYKYWAEDMGPVDAEFSEGSFFGGSPNAVSWFRRMFYTYHDHWLSKDKFVGKDQTVYNGVLLLFPVRFFGVSLWDTTQPAHKGIPFNADTALGTCGNTWYYYEWWMASKEARTAMADMWLEQAKGRSRGWTNFWKKSVRCKEGDALGVEGILKRYFGGWNAPRHDVKMQF